MRTNDESCLEYLRLDVYHIPFTQTSSVPSAFVPQVDFLDAGQAIDNIEDPVAAMIALMYSDDAGVQHDDHGVEGGEAGGVGYGLAVA